MEPALKLNGTVCPLNLAPFDQLDVSEIRLNSLFYSYSFC